MTRDPTVEEIEATYGAMAHAAIKEFAEKGEVMPALIAVGLDEASGDIVQIALIDPELVNTLQQHSTGKDKLMAMIRGLLRSTLLPFKADMIVHVSEVWTSTRTSLDDDPQRGEAIQVAVHTSERTYLGVSWITTEGGKRRAAFGPLFTTGHVLGRFDIQDHEGRQTH